MADFQEFVVKLDDSAVTRTGHGTLLHGQEPVRNLLASALDTGDRVFPAFPSLARRIENDRVLRSRPGFQKRPQGFRRLGSWVRVRTPLDPPRIRKRLARFQDVQSVERVAVAGRPVLPTLDATTVAASQDYLKDRPFGVGARSCWGPLGFSAGGPALVRVCVCDRSYLVHENIPDVQFLAQGTMTAPPGGLTGNEYSHGTSSLGVVGADPLLPPPRSGATGAFGVAWGAELLFSTTIETDVWDGPAAAIDRAIGGTDGLGASALQPGDVLLLEWAIAAPAGITFEDGSRLAPTSFPAEIDPHIRDAIAEAVALGIVVVQPAGNGGGHLQPIYETIGGASALRWDPADDTGAIVVGAGNLEPAGRVRQVGDTNFGPRVDCHSWGRDVAAPTVSSSTNPFNGATSHTPSYGMMSGTSAASAIVAGVCACAQWKHRDDVKLAAAPTELRALLRADENGEPQTFQDAEHPQEHRVGPQPDLTLLHQRIPRHGVVYQREVPSDLGGPRTDWKLRSRSPDIVIAPLGTVPDPGEPRDMVREYLPVPLDDKAVVIARVRNRKPTVESGDLSLYWSEPAAFLHPRWWKHFADKALAGIPEDFVGSTEPIPWTLPAVADGFLSWIGVLTPGGDLAPALPADMSTADYLEARHAGLQVTCFSLQHRSAAAGNATFRFRLRGVIEGDSIQTLDIASDLPEDMVLRVGIPAGGAPLLDESDNVLAADGAPFAKQLAAWTAGPHRFHLGAAQEIELRLTFEPAAPLPAFTHTTTIDQSSVLGSSTVLSHLGRMTLLLV